MKVLTEHFKEVEKRLEFPAEAVILFEKIAKRIENSQFFSARFEEARNLVLNHEHGRLDEALKKLNKLAVLYHIKNYSLHMVLLISLTEDVLARYREQGISEEIFWESVNDLKYKFKECVECKECYGTFVAGWNSGFICLNRFALGRFQFEHNEWNHDDFTTSAGVTIKKGDKTVGFHIPSSGVPLTDEVRLDAYKKAYEFFKDEIREDGNIIFECGSWLIYEDYKTFLPENSNTVKFINDFEIVSSEPRDKFNDAWRIFAKWGYKNPKKWPEDTSMRRAFKKFVLDGNKTGHGHGIIVFDGTKIVK